MPLRGLAARVVPLRSRLRSPNVSDSHSLAIRPGVTVQVYWLGERLGAGPGASLIVRGDEVMRLDCLGPGRGHMHVNLRQIRAFRGGPAARLYFPEQDIPAQIERSCFELQHNLPYALATNISPAVRRLRLNAQESSQAVTFMRERMHALLAAHREQKRA